MLPKPAFWSGFLVLSSGRLLLGDGHKLSFAPKSRGRGDDQSSQQGSANPLQAFAEVLEGAGLRIVCLIYHQNHANLLQAYAEGLSVEDF